MLLVDSSVWVDYFNGRVTRETDLLDRLLSKRLLLKGDIILAEVLQGFRRDADFRRARKLLDRLVFREMLGYEVAIAAARNYRRLRVLGVTVRKTVDVLIATFCITNKHTLLHWDRTSGRWSSIWACASCERPANGKWGPRFPERMAEAHLARPRTAMTILSAGETIRPFASQSHESAPASTMGTAWPVV